MFIIPFHYNLRRVGREGAKYKGGGARVNLHSFHFRGGWVGITT